MLDLAARGAAVEYPAYMGPVLQGVSNYLIAVAWFMGRDSSCGEMPNVPIVCKHLRLSPASILATRQCSACALAINVRKRYPP